MEADGSGAFAQCQVTVTEEDTHGFVDLGLPSGTLWAICNVGATIPEEFGDCFAWGETQPKDYYDWSTYKYCEGSYNTMTKYCPMSSFGYNGFTDDRRELESDDDAATANWGRNWKTPSLEQFDELINKNYTTMTWVKQNGVNGILVTSNSNNNNIFIPQAGYWIEGEFQQTGYGIGRYMTRSLYGSSPIFAYNLYIDPTYGIFTANSNLQRCYGQPVRPVRVK